MQAASLALLVLREVGIARTHEQKNPGGVVPPGVVTVILLSYEHQNGARTLEVECENALDTKR